MAVKTEISDVNLRFGNNIAKLRTKNKFTTRELADKLGITTTALYYYEKGYRTPSLDKILKLSELFSVSVDTLLKADVDNLQEINDVPCALILNGERYDFTFDRDAYEKTKKPFVINISGA